MSSSTVPGCRRECTSCFCCCTKESIFFCWFFLEPLCKNYDVKVVESKLVGRHLPCWWANLRWLSKIWTRFCKNSHIQGDLLAVSFWLIWNALSECLIQSLQALQVFVASQFCEDSVQIFDAICWSTLRWLTFSRWAEQSLNYILLQLIQ